MSNPLPPNAAEWSRLRSARLAFNARPLTHQEVCTLSDRTHIQLKRLTPDILDQLDNYAARMIQPIRGQQ